MNYPPWQITANLSAIIFDSIAGLNEEYIIKDGIAIHLSAQIEQGAVIKAPAIINANCFIGANAYLRGGVFLSHDVSIGPGSEIKGSYIGNNTAAAHFNFIGDSLIGSNVNFEAGSVIANHFNERKIKEIMVIADGEKINTGATKFGALVGDGCKIGANAVLSPGTVLLPGTVVRRLELVDQLA
jgi:UDP-N-acetylglucosamine diphosphorylase / glucose-1-phosphate thymidylyltransferase / UDP-N-acetylgalactosamine diphosphorylase / glucosamine-1-phosphate N-acetyltransferase / galactosamine-1-phosphate N-acetyltransferase